MNKKELIKITAGKAETTQKEAGIIIDAMFEAIEEALIDGEDVSIAGFGKFEVSEKPAATKRNPKTGEPVEVEAHNVVKFKPSSILKENAR